MEAGRQADRQTDRKGDLYQGPSEKVYEYLSLEGDTYFSEKQLEHPLLINPFFLISVL